MATRDNSVNARKWFVDANIQISPLTADNPVNTNHVLTVTANVNNGTGAGYVDVPDGTTISLSLTNSAGATATFTTGPGAGTAATSCTTTGGSCQATIKSPTAGTTMIHASMTISAGPTGAGFPAQAVLTRATGDGKTGDSADAAKNWLAAKIVIAPNATNEIGQNHTFTATVFRNTGSGYVAVGAGVPVTITLTNHNGAVANPAGPCTGSTNASGQFSLHVQVGHDGIGDGPCVRDDDRRRPEPDDRDGRHRRQLR